MRARSIKVSPDLRRISFASKSQLIVRSSPRALVCNLQELYRHLVDDFLVQYCRRLRKKDFTTKAENVSRKRKGKREYLNGGQTRHLMKKLNAFFEAIVEVPRIRIGGRQTIETLINEEALFLAKYLRGEGDKWVPRIARA